jgi:hypothetical protein
MKISIVNALMDLIEAKKIEDQKHLSHDISVEQIALTSPAPEAPPEKAPKIEDIVIDVEAVANSLLEIEENSTDLAEEDLAMIKEIQQALQELTEIQKEFLDEKIISLAKKLHKLNLNLMEVVGLDKQANWEAKANIVNESLRLSLGKLSLGIDIEA